MIEPPRITETQAHHAAVIHLTIPRDQIRNAVGPAINELLTALKAQGVAPAGPMFFYHLKLDPATFDVEVGFPVATPIAAAGRVRPGTLPGAKLAQTIYHGPYEGLVTAWSEFMKWVEAEGHNPAPNLWERYIAGPESSPDPATWRTELNRPLLE